jgi:uncharacterized lipoprotein NlpE involved in copper resistance
MNIVNVVKDLRVLVAELPSDLRRIADACMDSPIFDLYALDHASSSNIDSEVFASAPLPFPAYRVYVPDEKCWVLFLQRGAVLSALSLHLYRGGNNIIAISHIQYDVSSREAVSMDFLFLDRDSGDAIPYYKGDLSGGGYVNGFDEFVDSGDGDECADALLHSEIFNCHLALFFTAGTLALPGRFLASKSEKRHLSRPVEWQRSHQHYVILDKRHEANSRNIKHGAIVHADHGKALARMAHSRRAHYRILTSERFKAKRGQRVPVKSSWVGPAEWCDASNQVYKILL